MLWPKVWPRARESRFAGLAASDSTTGRRGRDAILSLESAYRYRRNTFRTLKRARNCASASTSRSLRKPDADPMWAALSLTIMPPFLLERCDGNSSLGDWHHRVPG